MLTTVTPAAQLLSMPSSAAMPPKLAPYPTEVGTAMTGLDTMPATTEGSAPSMPATTISTAAAPAPPRAPRPPRRRGGGGGGGSEKGGGAAPPPPVEAPPAPVAAEACH